MSKKESDRRLAKFADFYESVTRDFIGDKGKRAELDDAGNPSVKRPTLKRSLLNDKEKTLHLHEIK